MQIIACTWKWCPLPEDDREDPVGKEGDAGDDRVQGHVKGEAGPEVWFGIVEQWPQIPPTKDDITGN